MLHGLGIMINGSFVFGMDDDDEDVFRRTVDWAVQHGMTTATFHIQTPYPGTRLFARTEADGRILTRDWDRYDTRHVVYRPALLRPEALEDGSRDRDEARSKAPSPCRRCRHGRPIPRVQP